MKRFASLVGLLVLPACATTSAGQTVFEDPASFEGEEVHLCGHFRSAGLTSGHPASQSLEVMGAPEDFHAITNWGRKCLTGVVRRTGYDPATDICVDNCNVWALDVTATPPPKVNP